MYDLIVLGGGDPDFHRENAFLLAHALNKLGVKTVRGDLRVVVFIALDPAIDGQVHRLQIPIAVIGQHHFHLPGAVRVIEQIHPLAD